MEQALRGVKWQEYGSTVLNPVAFIFVIVMGILLIRLPRRYAIIPIIAVMLYITYMQRIVVASLDFDMGRIISLFGLARIFLKSEHRAIKLNLIDKTMIYYVLWSIIAGVFYYGTVGALANRLGGALTIAGSYFICRILVRDIQDIEIAIKAMVFMSVPIALLMLNEQITRRNFFSFLGGVSEITRMRDGRLRSEGSLGHPILAGTFGATLMPLVMGYWHKNKSNKKILIIGLISTTLITITSASSGPLISYMTAILGLNLWVMRDKMKLVIWGCIACIIGLDIVMKAPVWFLIARAGIVDGSTATHRARIIQKAVERFSEWALLGTYGSGHWGWGLEDVTNWYVRHCISGGLLYFILFLLVIYFCFKAVGHAVREADNLQTKRLVWALGACMFSHTVSFLGVSYFGQIVFFWFMLLAMISSVSSIQFKKVTDQPIPSHHR